MVYIPIENMSAEPKEIVLSVFDFDGTLFRSPSPSQAAIAKYGPDIHQPVFAGGLGWFQHKATLSVPFVPEKIDRKDEKWFIQPTVEAYLAAKREGHVTAILTGREEHFRSRITQLVNDAGMTFDHIFLKQELRGGTVAFKVDVFAKLIAQYQPSKIAYYEDREDQGAKIQEAYNLLREGKRPHQRVEPLAADLLPFAQNFAMIMVTDDDVPFAPEVEEEVLGILIRDAQASRAQQQRWGNRGRGYRN